MSLRLEGVPSLLMTSSSRSAISVLQRKLQIAQTEVASGRNHDLGLTLGRQIGGNLALRAELESAKTVTDRINVTRVQATAAQDALGSLSGIARDMIATLTGARGAQGGVSLAVSAAESALGSFESIVNAKVGEEYLFGGASPDRPPLRGPYSDEPKAAIDAAFLAEFGFAQSDGQSASVDSGAMTAFLEGRLADLFDDSGWTRLWSSAGGAGSGIRLSGENRVNPFPNADGSYVRKLAEGLGMILSLGDGSYAEATFQTAVDKAMAKLAEADGLLIAEQSRIGFVQSDLAATIERLERREAVLLEHIRQVEQVDPYEAATRVNDLMTHLESSYAITARISRLNLLDYL